MSFTKSVGALLLVSLAACAANPSADEAMGNTESSMTGPTTEGATFTTTARLNLRESASMSADVLLTIPAGATVTAVDGTPEAGFYHVEYDGTDGWAHGTYLKAAAGAPAGDDDETERTPAATPEAGDEGDFNGRTYSGVTMLWQGNWDFLIKCDSYSRNAGNVTFYCGEAESRSFVDDAAWVAMPSGSMSRKMCNQEARVCKGGNCIVAKIVERSVTAGRWEGSTAVLDALGVETGFSSCSSSTGTATGVTITLK